MSYTEATAFFAREAHRDLMNQENTTGLEQGWLLMQKWIDNLNSTLEGMPEPQLGLEDCQMLLKTMNYMCALNGTSNYVQQMCDKFQESFEEHIKSTVYQERFRDVAISLIRQERKGEQIDQDVLKKVLYIFVGNGIGWMDYYIDFEAAMLEETTDYYSLKACVWILEDSCSG